MPLPRDLDARLHAWIGGLPTTPADQWLRRLSTAADHGRLWLLIALALGARPGRLRRGALHGTAAMALTSALVNAVLKPLFGRVRPDLENLRTERRLRREPGSLSFPSGHSGSAAAFVTGLALESPAAGAALAPLALGIGYSRVHVGVHYPGDVLAGLAVGGVVAASARKRWSVRGSRPTVCQGVPRLIGRRR